MKTHEDMIEISGSIIDVFEDFLESKNIQIPNEDREEHNKENEDNGAIIFGSDYDSLEDDIENILKGVLK